MSMRRGRRIFTYVTLSIPVNHCTLILLLLRMLIFLLVKSMIAGGIGGSSGDMLMHSLDTVKTRQQGDPHIPPRYGSTSASYIKILREEGFRRGLYSGVSPALMGSFPGTVIFFGTYEWSKRHMIDSGINPTLSYLSAGIFLFEKLGLTGC